MKPVFWHPLARIDADQAAAWYAQEGGLTLELAFTAIGLFLIASTPALAHQGQVLTTLETSVVAAAKGWETTVMNAARSLFWILAGL